MKKKICPQISTDWHRLVKIRQWADRFAQIRQWADRSEEVRLKADVLDPRSASRWTSFHRKKGPLINTNSKGGGYCHTGGVRWKNFGSTDLLDEKKICPQISTDWHRLAKIRQWTDRLAQIHQWADRSEEVRLKADVLDPRSASRWTSFHRKMGPRSASWRITRILKVVDIVTPVV
jgi:IS5 family transposase